MGLRRWPRFLPTAGRRQQNTGRNRCVNRAGPRRRWSSRPPSPPARQCGVRNQPTARSGAAG
eukprot:7155725-Pyramimonas_sp.AAC.1